MYILVPIDQLILMGVKNLIKFIEKTSPSAITYKRIDNYENTRIGFDANLLIYKIIYGIRVRGYDIKNNNRIVTHIHSLLLKFFGFIKYGIEPVFVFDTKFPEIKYKTLKNREESKRKIIKKHETKTSEKSKRIHYYVSTDVTREEIDECKKLMIIFGYNIILAKEEADSQLVKLYDNGVIDYIASDDMDILLFGGRRLLKNFTINPKKYIQEIDLGSILAEGKITMDQFIRIGISYGTDYCDNKPSTSKQVYKDVIDDKDVVKKVCKKAYEYFMNSPVHDIKNLNYDMQIDNRQLKDFLLETGHNKDYIKKVIKNIRK